MATGRTALVTGASRGIGRACAVALAEVGHDVALTARSADDLAAVRAEVERRGRRALALPADVSRAEEVRAVVERTAAELGPIGVLVNSAGIELSARLVETGDAEWARVLDVNLTGVFYCTRAVLPAMIERRWGRIINIASTAARTGHKYTAAYAASKHGVLGLTRALAIEVAGEGVTVNAVCPGWVDTAMLERATRLISTKTGKSIDEARRALAAMNPQGRLVRPEEVAALVVFVASEAAQPITGQALGIDGGEVRA